MTTFNELMISSEKSRLQFVATEIGLGFTLLESAQISYNMGHGQRGDSALDKAETAWRSAKKFLGEQRSEKETTALRSELDRLRTALDHVQKPPSS